MGQAKMAAAAAETLAAVENELGACAERLPPPEQVLVRDLRIAAVAYANERVAWQLGSKQERIDRNRGRSLAHQAFIDACNAVSRRCQIHELSTDWRKELGDAGTTAGRKRIGDFACWIAFSLAFEAR